MDIFHHLKVLKITTILQTLNCKLTFLHTLFITTFNIYFKLQTDLKSVISLTLEVVFKKGYFLRICSSHSISYLPSSHAKVRCIRSLTTAVFDRILLYWICRTFTGPSEDASSPMKAIAYWIKC